MTDCLFTYFAYKNEQVACVVVLRAYTHNVPLHVCTVVYALRILNPCHRPPPPPNLGSLRAMCQPALTYVLPPNPHCLYIRYNKWRHHHHPVHDDIIGRLVCVPDFCLLYAHVHLLNNLRVNDWTFLKPYLGVTNDMCLFNTHDAIMTCNLFVNLHLIFEYVILKSEF